MQKQIIEMISSSIRSSGAKQFNLKLNQSHQKKLDEPKEDLKASSQINDQCKIEKKIQSIFDQYVNILNSKILKRKIILLVLNSLLTLLALLFAVFFILLQSQSSQQQGELKIEEIFNAQTSLITLGCILAIGILSFFFSIIIYKGKVTMLHCYWVSCLVFLIIFSVVAASAFYLTSLDCSQPSSYILQKLYSTSQSANNMYCSDICPCKQISSLNEQSGYQTIQDCPAWEENIYSSFFSSIEESFKCSGWCSINPKSYYTFYYSQQIPQQSTQVSCFDSIRKKIQTETSYLRIFSMMICGMLMMIIFYTNYYIFMEKEDQNREAKKMKRKIKENQQKMQDELLTSKRMLS